MARGQQAARDSRASCTGEGHWAEASEQEGGLWDTEAPGQAEMGLPGSVTEGCGDSEHGMF